MDNKFNTIEVVKGNVTNRGNFIERKNNYDIDYFEENVEPDTFHSAFMHSKDIVAYVEEHRSASGYSGEVGSECLFWDIDNSDLSKSLEDTKVLVNRLSLYNTDNINVYFSGCKGFHVVYFCPELSEFTCSNIHNLIKGICTNIAHGLDCFDGHIYDKTRIIRSPNTVNSKTGLYKIPLTIEQLNTLTIESICELAKTKHKQSFNCDGVYSEKLLTLIENTLNNTITYKDTSKKINYNEMLEGIKHGFNEGDRNTGLTSVAGLLRSRNFSNDITYSFLSSINANSSSPVPDRDIWNIVNSVAKYSPNPLYITPTSSDIVTMREAADKWVKLRSRTGKLNSGFKHVDDIMPYFDPGEVLFIAARSGVGKTTLGMQLSHGIAKGYGGYGLFASLEMPTTSIFVRSAIMESSILSGNKKTYEEVATELTNDSSLIDKVVDKWSNLLIIDKTSVNVEQLKQYFEVANEKYDFGINNYLIDYVGLIGGASDYDGLSQTARGLKHLAKALNTRIIVIVQLSRKAGDGTVPVSIDMLRDSGALEESADYIMGMWLNKKDPTLMHCSLIKNRFGDRNKMFNIRNIGLHYTSEDYQEFQ